jgi:uncharacterized protein involved in type VI secretion and phage assembly
MADQATVDKYANATDAEIREAAAKHYVATGATLTKRQDRLEAQLREKLAQAKTDAAQAEANLQAVMAGSELPHEDFLAEYMNKPRRGRRPKSETNGEG